MVKPHPSRWFERAISTPLLVLVMFVFVIATFGPALGLLQGKLLPVTSRVTLTDVAYDKITNRTTFVMEFDKYLNCALIGYSFRRFGVNVVAGPADVQPPVTTLSPGLRRSGKWFVTGPPPLDDMTMQWQHSCHFLWTVVTDATPLPEKSLMELPQ